jgi:hypothetical protein
MYKLIIPDYFHHDSIDKPESKTAHLHIKWVFGT